ncbi:MAG: hypothetical protein IPK10_20085 [Bacteroidetes bacterium]|nr:hypothetical protein [Bacteroidota bacterium]
MFKSNEEMAENYHPTSIGCLMDFCRDKREVSLKMRTADICLDCQKIIQEKNISFQRIKFTLETMDAIREQHLFRERFSLLKKYYLYY